MSTVPGYTHLTEEDLEGYEWAIAQLYPAIERAWDENGLVGFCLPLVTTWRGNTYDLYILFPGEYPDREPRGILDPPPVPGAPHLYADGKICVHDRGYSAAEWSPAVGFTLARCWLEAYEDWHYDGRDFQGMHDIPDDIRERVEGMG